MVFWGMVSPDVGVATVGYPKAMLVTIGLWLVVFPLANRGGNKGKGVGFKFRSPVREEVKQGFRSAASEKSGSSSSNAQTLSDDEIDITSSFTGISRKVTSQNFTGGNVITNFGGVQLDLTDATLANNEAELKVRAFIGGIEITVPEGWDVQTNVSATLAGVEDDRNRPGSHAAGAPRLLISGSATMGGISIKD